MATVYEYSLKYNANGGTGAPSTQTASSTKLTYIFIISFSEPSRTGYRFMGWANGSSGGVAWHPGDEMERYASDPSKTIYAVWEKRTYIVSYNANGGSGAPGSQTKTYGVNLTLSSTVPTRSGYTFQGWALSASGGAVYSPGDTYSDNASVTLYAAWQSDGPTTYTVHYNANGGTGAPASQTKTHGVALTLRTGIPTREGSDFLGWGTSAAATSPTYQPGGTYTANASITLYAVWSDAVPATGVMYHSDGTAVMPGDPYIANNGLLPGTAFIVIGGVLKEGK